MDQLKLTEVRLDGGTQCRTAISQQAVDDYADLIRAGTHLPPLKVMYDGKHYWLWDGFHRWHAYRTVDAQLVEVEITKGTRREAVLAAVGANADHGLQRTNADKREAVLVMLQDEEWGNWSDRDIARYTNTSHPFVANVRRSIQPPGTGQGGNVTTPDNEITSFGDDEEQEQATEGEQGPAPDTESGTSTAPAPAPEEKWPIDKLGTPIDNPEVAEAFRSTMIRQALNQLQTFMIQVSQLANDRVAAPHLNHQQIDADLKSVKSRLRAAKPYAVCPYCGGDKCKACKGAGWMPKHTYEAVPEGVR